MNQSSGDDDVVQLELLAIHNCELGILAPFDPFPLPWCAP